MNKGLIKNQYASSFVERQDKKPNFTGLRSYKYSPDLVNISIITFGHTKTASIGSNPKKLKDFRVVSSCQIDKKELKQYIKQLQQILKEDFD